MVIPLRDISIARIELLAVWIRSGKGWNVFVRNQVFKIQQLSDVGQWSFVPGEENPADLPLRRYNAKQLLNSKWVAGLEWLRKNVNE